MHHWQEWHYAEQLIMYVLFAVFEGGGEQVTEGSGGTRMAQNRPKNGQYGGADDALVKDQSGVGLMPMQ